MEIRDKHRHVRTIRGELLQMIKKKQITKKNVNSETLSILAAILFGIMVVVVVLLLATVSFKTSEYTYAAFIKKQLYASCIPMIVLGILFSLFGLIFFKIIDSKVIENWMIVVWFSLCIAFAFYTIATISIHYIDIKNEDYMVYTGEFEKDRTKDFVFLDDEDSTRLKNRNETFLETGYYSGTIVYSKRSKYVLSYSLNSGENASVADNP